MKIVYAPLINVEGQLVGVEADLEGNVELKVSIKGRVASIKLAVMEAAKLNAGLKAVDIDTLVAIHGT